MQINKSVCRVDVKDCCREKVLLLNFTKGIIATEEKCELFFIAQHITVNSTGSTNGGYSIKEHSSG